MDPTAAYNEMLLAYSEGNWEAAAELASGLLVWLEKNGFPPVGKSRVEVTAKCNEMAKLHLCKQVGTLNLVTRDQSNGKQHRVYGLLNESKKTFLVLVGYHVPKFVLKNDRYCSKDTVSYVTDIKDMKE